jgi:hypothetical protein
MTDKTIASGGNSQEGRISTQPMRYTAMAIAVLERLSSRLLSFMRSRSK